MSSEPIFLLPEAFRSLEPFAGWSLPTETERNHKRRRSSMAEIEAFRDAILPEVDAIVAYLDRAPLAELPATDLPLLHLLLSLAEIAPAIEFYHQPTVVDGFESERMPADEDFVLRPAI